MIIDGTMSLVFPYWDSENECLDFSKDGFILCDYFVDLECTKSSTKLLGRYKRTVKWKFNPTTPYEQHIIEYASETNREPINERGGLCEYFINNGVVKLVSENIELNPDYNPVFWQQEYDLQLEAITQAEKEGHRIY